VLPPKFYHPLLNDSKQLTEARRQLLRPIIEAQALAWAVGWASPQEIDAYNILQATYLAMHRAIAQLAIEPGFLLVDGNRFKPYAGIGHACMVKGDGRFASIAAASILAKTHRDALVQTLHAEFPHYGWDKNKTYGTATHRAAIEQHGTCVHHRKSFKI
jgi:ribonuclease HII